MRLSQPRLVPLSEAEWSDEVREVLRSVAGGVWQSPPNIFTTLARHPKLLKRWLVFGSHILGKNTIAPRERELIILRVGWLCRSQYEWSQHVVIGRACGLTDDEITRVTQGPDAAGWNTLDAVLLTATDELCRDHIIGNATWDALRGLLDDKQLIDLVFTVGQYVMVSMALNTLGVALDAGYSGFPGNQANQ